jgi:hypothetical protein
MADLNCFSSEFIIKRPRIKQLKRKHKPGGANT